MNLPTWNVYRHQPLDDREKLFLSWCKKHKRDPENEDDVNAFFDDLDRVVETEEVVEYKKKKRLL